MDRQENRRAVDALERARDQNARERLKHGPVGDGIRGPITMRFRELFFDTVRGRNPDYAQYLTRVRAQVASPTG